MYRVVVITLSDEGYKGNREDISGVVLEEFLIRNNFNVVNKYLLSDDLEPIKELLTKIADNNEADLIITTGGTGLSIRDNTPEATLLVINKQVPGIMEWIRYKSMEITKRAMLSRGVCGVRNKTLIINLPGSPKAVLECISFVIDEIPHALGILTGRENNCGEGD